MIDQPLLIRNYIKPPGELPRPGVFNLRARSWTINKVPAPLRDAVLRTLAAWANNPLTNTESRLSHD